MWALVLICSILVLYLVVYFSLGKDRKGKLRRANEVVDKSDHLFFKIVRVVLWIGALGLIVKVILNSIYLLEQ